MTNFDCDAYTGATPLALVKENGSVNILNMVVGKTAGTIGETSMIAILIGACILLIMGVIDLRVPGTYIVSFVIFIVLFGGHGLDPAFITAHLAGGGLMLGAFFMATDYVTSPTTPLGKLVFGIGAGLITVLIREWGIYPEGVSFAILIMNILNPYIDSLTARKMFGGAKK